MDIKQLASQLNCFPSTLGKKALANIVYNELNISTCGNILTGKKRSCIENEIGDEETTWLSYLQKLRNWGKSISSLPENIDIQDVKRFLIGSGFKDECPRILPVLVHNQNEDCIFQALNGFIRRFTVLYNSVLILIRSEPNH